MEGVEFFLSREGSTCHKPLGEAATIKKIDKKLSKKKAKGLTMLEEFLKGCSDAAFAENCVKWLQQCTKLDGDDLAVNERSLNMFSELMKFAVKFPELVRPITNSVVSRFLDVFMKKLSGCEAAWEALQVVLGSYRGPLASYKDTLETMMIEKITRLEPIKEHEARCFALLPSVGGVGTKGLAYRNNWRAQFDRFLGTCQHILNRIFTDVRELQLYDTEIDSALTFAEEASISDLVSNFINTSKIMQAMLLGRYPAAKMIPVDSVLGLVSRGLSVSGATLGTKDLERNSELREELPQLHHALLGTLTALIVCCGRTLLPVSSVIAKLLGQAVDVASVSTDLRIAAYSSISNWLTVARSGSCVDRIAKPLIATVVGDILYKRPPVVLKDKSKKTNEPVRIEMITFSGRETVCFAALKTLDLVINSVGYLLPPDQHKMLQGVVIQLATDMLRRTEQNTPVYGAAPQCRAALFSVLLQLCLEPSPRWPPPTQFACELLRGGQNDSDPTVAATCSAGITMLERIVHPEFSVAAFPVDYRAVLKDQERCDDQALEPPLSCLSTNTEEVATLPLKLVTKSSGPWESLHFNSKNSSPRVPKPEDGPKEVIVLDGVEEDLNDCPVIIDMVTAQTAPKKTKSLDLPVTPIKDNPLKDVEDRKRLSPNSLDEDDSSAPSKKQKRTEKMDSPLSDKSDSEGTKNYGELEKPRPVPNTPPQLLKDENSNSSASSKQYKLRLRHPKTSSEVVDLDSPMALRSGAVVGGSSGSSQLVRTSSVVSLSSQGSSTIPATLGGLGPRASPISEVSESEDALALFNDTIRPDYK